MPADIADKAVDSPIEEDPVHAVGRFQQADGRERPFGAASIPSNGIPEPEGAPDELAMVEALMGDDDHRASAAHRFTDGGRALPHDECPASPVQRSKRRGLHGVVARHHGDRRHPCRQTAEIRPETLRVDDVAAPLPDRRIAVEYQPVDERNHQSARGQLGVAEFVGKVDDVVVHTEVARIDRTHPSPRPEPVQQIAYDLAAAQRVAGDDLRINNDVVDSHAPVSGNQFLIGPPNLKMGRRVPARYVGIVAQAVEVMAEEEQAPSSGAERGITFGKDVEDGRLLAGHCWRIHVSRAEQC